MIDPASTAYTRRMFLRTGVTLASAAVTIPAFIQNSALAMAWPDGDLSSRPGVPQDRILVVVQLAGGNDGLNTVVPFGDAAYYRARPTIGIPEREVLRFNDSLGVGLHPALASMKQMFDEGVLAVVQGAGYPNPNRSHFVSTDIWSTADTSGVGDGWLGRYFDNQCAGAPAAAGGTSGGGSGGAPGGCSGHDGVALGRTAPLMLQGHKFKPISFETAELFRWTGLDLHPSMKEPYDDITRIAENHPESAADDSSASFLTRTALDAQLASERIRKAVALQPLVQYPGSRLAQQLAMVSAMIRSGMQTRVYYVSHGGFDTHSGQGGVNGGHANLIRQLADALLAFRNDLKAQGNDGRVLTMTFSEFGRRVGQNGSGGTDHGTAAPMFLMGPMVRPGVLGSHPSLTDLDQGDLKFTVDFRSVYAGVLEQWMRAESQPILKGRFKAANVIRA